MTCPRCFCRHCRCTLNPSEAAQIAAADSAERKRPERSGKQRKTAGVLGKVVPHMGAGRRGRASSPNY